MLGHEEYWVFFVCVSTRAATGDRKIIYDTSGLPEEEPYLTPSVTSDRKRQLSKRHILADSGTDLTSQ
jgi:hypothetical protein